MDNNQTTRLSKHENELIKVSFGKDDNLIYQIRDVLFQFSDKAVNMSDELKNLLKKTMIPSPSQDVPILCQSDNYFRLSIKEMNPGVAVLHIKAKDLVNAYLEQQLSILFGEEVTKTIGLEDLKTLGDFGQEESRFVNMLAYLELTNSLIDSCLFQLKTLANKKEETEEEIKKKIEKDSNK